MVHLSRIAEDFILFTSEEFGFLRARRRRGDGQQPDAAEEESRSARARPRQERPRDRPPHRLAGDDEGVTRGLQQGGPSGGQRGALRCRRYVDRLPARRVVGRGRIEAERRGIHARPRRGLLLATDVADYLVAKGPAVPRTRTRWWGAPGAAVCSRKAGPSTISASTNGASTRRSSATTCAGAITPLASIDKKQTPQSTSPKAVAAAVAELKDWLTRRT